MNSSQLVEQIVRDREERSAHVLRAAQGGKEEDAHAERLGHVADMLDSLVSELRRATLTVRVQNQPSRMAVTGRVSLEEADEITAALEDLEEALGSKLEEHGESLREALAEHRTHSVDNFPVFPAWPEFPRRTESAVVSMPKYVQEGLEGIRRAVRDIKTQVNVEPAPVVLEPTDLGPLLSRLGVLEGVLRDIAAKEAPEPPGTDLEPLERSLESIAEVMRDVRSNTGAVQTQTFRSSWDKSFTMKSQDLPTSFAYKASTLYPSDHTRDVADYVQVTDVDGKSYRRTFSYNAYDQVSSVTAWIKQ